MDEVPTSSKSHDEKVEENTENAPMSSRESLLSDESVDNYFKVFHHFFPSIQSPNHFNFFP